MKFSLSWLRQHLETDATLDEISETLTMIGLEVEKIEDRAAALAGFVVAEVIEASPHPDADKLQVCRVNPGDGSEVQVICGAPNARTGMKGVFAGAGAYVPGIDLKLKKTKIRGVESNGMLLSEREMGLSDEHEGIVELEEDAPLGESCVTAMGLDDPVIEVQIMPDRQDCLGVNGIARDLAAAGLGTYKPLVADHTDGTYDSPVNIWLDFPEGREEDCSHFAGRYIKGVKNGPSPKWMQDKLIAVGLRPISSLVDITNYLTIDRGRPLHVYDADKLVGDIGARPGKKGESYEALDGETYEVEEGMTVIADGERVLGFGGIMGGTHSGCTEATQNVLVESAMFRPETTAITGRRTGIQSDARYRFERGVDPESSAPGMEAATRLILELCGGEPSHAVSAGGVIEWKKTLTLDPGRIKKLCNLDVAAKEQARILGSLGFGVTAEGDNLSVAVPSWRRDIDGADDLVEEVARIHGYDKIPAVPMVNDSPVTRTAITTAQRRRIIAKRVLAGRGMVEVVTWSFMARAEAELFGGGADDLVLANPISSELDTMRPGILGNLILATGRNVARGHANVALFEVGQVYADDTPEGQTYDAAGVRRGLAVRRQWAGAARDADTYDAKADALALLRELGAPVDKLQVTGEAPAWYHPGHSGRLMLGPKNMLAAFGEVHPRVLAALDVDGPLVGFEVFLDNIPFPKAKATKARPALAASDLPVVERDFAFVVDGDVPAGELVKAARGADKALITRAEVFDVYTGKGIPDGAKSLALVVRLEPTEKTLTDAEIEAVSDKVVAAVTKATGATLRG